MANGGWRVRGAEEEGPDVSSDGPYTDSYTAVIVRCPFSADD